MQESQIPGFVIPEVPLNSTLGASLQSKHHPSPIHPTWLCIGPPQGCPPPPPQRWTLYGWLLAFPPPSPHPNPPPLTLTLTLPSSPHPHPPPHPLRGVPLEVDPLRLVARLQEPADPRHPRHARGRAFRPEPEGDQAAARALLLRGASGGVQRAPAGDAVLRRREAQGVGRRCERGCGRQVWRGGGSLVASNGHRLGTLCFADVKPRVWDAGVNGGVGGRCGEGGALWWRPTGTVWGHCASQTSSPGCGTQV